MDKHKFAKNTKNINPKKKNNRLLMQPAGHHDGCTAWRFDWVRQALNYNKAAVVEMSSIPHPVFVPSQNNKQTLNPIVESADAICIQRPVLPHYTHTAKQYEYVQDIMRKRNVTPFRFIIDVDDVMHSDHIAEFNVAKDGYMDNKRFDTFKEIVQMSDELHVCSPTMQDFYRDVLEFKNVTHRPNMMPKCLFDGFDPTGEINRLRFEKHKDRPRIVWAGSWTHVDVKKQSKVDDFTKIKDFCLSTIDEYQWIFFGAHPDWIAPAISEGKAEYHPWVGIFDFPRMLWELEPTVVFAPLDDNTFNKCKSNIKLTETGALGIAGIYQDLDPYAEAPLKFNSGDELADQLKYLLHDWDNYSKIANEMKEISQGYFLENNLDLLKASYFTDCGSIERSVLSKKLIRIQKE